MKTKTLLIGSGIDAAQASKWELEGWTVCALNNSWSIIPDLLNYHIRAGDWIPAKNNRVPKGFYTPDGPVMISYKEYDSKIQKEKFGGQGVGIGSTMFFNGAYWILGNLNPSLIGFIGCSMNYPNGDANTFYGGGNADPLRFSNKYLLDRFRLLEKKCDSTGVKLINFGDDGLMPYSKMDFNSYCRSNYLSDMRLFK